MLKSYKFSLLTASILIGLALSTVSHADDDIDKKTKTLSTVSVSADTIPDIGSVDEQRLSVSVNSVMSKQEMNAVPSANIADVVAHMPGLSAYSDMHLGQAATGENEYVTIRGLDSSYNAYTLNGFALPETDSSTRAISLNMLAPFGIQSVKVSKAPTPDMPGDSIGGTIDMRTPTAFDFEKDSYAKTTVQGQMNSLAHDLGVSNKGGTIQQEFARRFGENKAYGIYAAVYYGKNNTAAEAVAPNSSYKPVDPSQTNHADLSQAGLLQSSQYKYSIYTNQIKRYGANVSLDWHGETTSLYARAIYGAYSINGQQDQASARNQSATTILRGGYFNTRDMDEKTAALQLGGNSRLDQLELDYGSSFGYGTRNRPDYVEASLYGAPTPGQFAFDLSNPTYPSIAGNPAALRNNFYSLNTDSFWKVQGHDAGSKDTRINAHVDGTYRVNAGPLESFKFGVSADTSKRNAYDHPFFHDDNNFIYGGPYFGGPNYPYNAPGGPSLGALPGQVVNGAFDGRFAGPFKLINRSWVLSQAVPYKYVNDPRGAGNYTANDYNANTTSSRENIYAAYVMTTLRYGDFTVLPGVRYELTHYSASSWQSNGDDATGQFVSTGRTYGEVLPGISVNYRPDDLSVYRASVRRSFSRPAFGLISGETTYSIDDTTGQVVGISKPNPNLKPTTADNLDLSAEFYDANGGLLTASTYYKRIKNFVYTSQSSTSNDSTLGGNVPTGTVITGGIPVSMPENGGTATLYGAELAVRKQFVSLPGVWKHFGIGSNLTLQHSSADSQRSDHQGQKTWLPRAPERIYNIDLFYDDAKLRADLTYNYTGLQLIGLTGNGLDYYLQPVKTLNFNATYHLPYGVDIGVAVKNLLNNATFYETQGKSRRYLAYDPGADGAYLDTGRVYMLNLSYTF
ncbi:TonB-dependent receptor [Dyella silvatica]|uniref:TonB-dependent receptor n=1 Tax=Dyella silvatica TaxID=2992128 RepID=UPI00225B102F|nr:TonB-dependent receptor [Dyella silvatica]